MYVCPLISSGGTIMNCHPNCALKINGECGIRILAQSALSSSQEQPATHPAQD